MPDSQQLQNINAAAPALAADNLQHQVFESLVLKGDISNLDAAQKAKYLERLCNSLGLNPLTQPFLPLKLNGKEILYASRGCTDQLANVHKITREIIKTEQISDVYVATCRASMPDGRFDISTGAVTIGNKKGDDLANALMKAETKAKRRATLSLCGLGFLDESEIETIPKERVERVPDRPATKGQLIDDAQSQATAPATEGKNLPWDPPATSATAPLPATKPQDDPLAAEEYRELRPEVEALARAIGKSQPEIDEALKYIDSNPQWVVSAYCKAARSVISTLIETAKWPYSEEGTVGYLERFGITVLGDASRGQLQACIANLRETGLLPTS